MTFFLLEEYFKKHIHTKINVDKDVFVSIFLKKEIKIKILYIIKKIKN